MIVICLFVVGLANYQLDYVGAFDRWYSHLIDYSLINIH
jgi:hypothetical protein